MRVRTTRLSSTASISGGAPPPSRRQGPSQGVVETTGLEPAPSAGQAPVLPLHHVPAGDGMRTHPYSTSMLEATLGTCASELAQAVERRPVPLRRRLAHVSPQRRRGRGDGRGAPRSGGQPAGTGDAAGYCAMAWATRRRQKPEEHHANDQAPDTADNLGDYWGDDGNPVPELEQPSSGAVPRRRTGSPACVPGAHDRLHSRSHQVPIHSPHRIILTPRRDVGHVSRYGSADPDDRPCLLSRDRLGG